MEKIFGTASPPHEIENRIVHVTDAIAHVSGENGEHRWEDAERCIFTTFLCRHYYYDCTERAILLKKKSYSTCDRPKISGHSVQKIHLMFVQKKNSGVQLSSAINGIANPSPLNVFKCTRFVPPSSIFVRFVPVCKIILPYSW